MAAINVRSQLMVSRTGFHVIFLYYLIFFDSFSIVLSFRNFQLRSLHIQRQEIDKYIWSEFRGSKFPYRSFLYQSKIDSKDGRMKGVSEDSYEHFLQSYGFNNQQCHDILAREPRLVQMRPRHDLPQKIRKIDEILQLKNEEMKKIINNNPEILLSELQFNLGTNLDYLRRQGFDTPELRFLFNEALHILGTQSTEEVSSQMSYFIRFLCLTTSEMKTLVLQHPHLLSTEKAQFLRSKVDFLNQKLDFRKVDIKRIIMKRPAFFVARGYRLELISAFLMKELHLAPKEIRSAFLKLPIMMSLDPEITKDKLAFFEEKMKMESHEIKEIVIKSPRILTLGLENIEQKFSFLSEDLGFGNEEILNTLARNSYFLHASLENMKRVVAFFVKEYEISFETVKELVSSYPQLLGLNLDRSIRPKIDFFSAELNASKPQIQARLIQYPIALSCNLEDRFIKRTRFLRWLGISADFNLVYSVAPSTDHVFIRRIRNSIQNEKYANKDDDYLLWLLKGPIVLPALGTKNDKSREDEIKQDLSALLRSVCQMSHEDANKIISSEPELTFRQTSTLNSRILFYQKHLNLNVAELQKLLAAFPTMLLYSIEDQIIPQFDYYKENFYFDTTDMKKMFLKSPKVLGLNIQQDINPKVEYLCQEFRFSKKEVGTMFLASPNVILDMEQDMISKLQFLPNGEKMSKASMRNIILKRPELLGRRANIKSATINFLSNQLCFTDNELAVMLEKLPYVMSKDLGNILPKVAYLMNEVNMSTTNIKTLLLKFPNILTQSLDKSLKPKTRFFLQEVGLSEAQLCRILVSSPYILSSNLEGSLKLIIKKFQITYEIPQERIVEMVVKYPQLFGLSYEKNIKLKFEFLHRSFCSSKEEMRGLFLTKNPSFLLFSLRKRFIPRFELLKAVGLHLSLVEFITFLQYSDRKFVSKVYAMIENPELKLSSHALLSFLTGATQHEEKSTNFKFNYREATYNYFDDT